VIRSSTKDILGTMYSGAVNNRKRKVNSSVIMDHPNYELFVVIFHLSEVQLNLNVRINLVT